MFRTLPALGWLLVGGISACGRSTAPDPSPSPLGASVLRAAQAPIAGLPDVLETDTLLGKRVRVLGWCVAAPNLLAGRRTGLWLLGSPDTTIEVRGLVPAECGPNVVRQALVLVFAQIVSATPDSGQRLLLRLPD